MDDFAGKPEYVEKAVELITQKNDAERGQLFKDGNYAMFINLFFCVITTKVSDGLDAFSESRNLYDPCVVLRR